jgi:hypothetical protein
VSGSKFITYLGATDPRDSTVVYVLPGPPGEPNLELAIGHPVEVTAAQAKALNGDEEHRFGSGKVEFDPDAAAPWPDYATLDADEAIARIDNPALTATAAKAREVEAWEKDHDDRKTVVEAATHQAEVYEAGEPAAEADGVESEKG